MKNCPQCQQAFDDALSFCPRDGEVLQEAEDDLVGRVLDGKYEVESFIARGGMGAVYRARHILLGDRVVIKTLRPEMRGNAEWLRRFQREGRAARSFRHPNAVTVYDLSAASDGGLIYMVMEYVEGRTLDKELRARGRLAPAEAVSILSTVADVLDAAHARGVVHRDLKPENIMLGKGEGGRETIKVLDLGIAKMLGADAQSGEATSLTVAGQILGTPYYMSPEQWGELPRDGRAEIDGRADIYSLGVIAFELVAGRKPLGGKTIPELRQAHVSATLPSVQTFAPDVPEAFGRAVARAMAKDRNDRPSTAGEFIEELRAALDRHDGVGEAAIVSSRQSGAAGVEHLSARATEGEDLMRGRRTSASPEIAETVVEGAPENFTGVADTSPRARDHSTSAGVAGSTAQPIIGSAAASSNQLRAHEGAARADRLASAGDAQRISQDVSARDAAKGKGKSFVAGAAVALLILLGVGAWLAWNRFGVRGAGETNRESAGANASAVAPASKVEALSYWVEAFGVSGNDAPRRLARESLTLASGEYFQFHFVPRERGYIYLIGPGGEGNAPTLFLGARGAGALKTNQLAAGAVFTFPFGERAALRLDRNPGAEDYTVIFSPTPLTEPAALTKDAPYVLTPEELRAVEDIRARQRANAPALNAEEKPDGARVSVLIPETRDAAHPLVFDIRIEHR